MFRNLLLVYWYFEFLTIFSTLNYWSSWIPNNLISIFVFVPSWKTGYGFLRSILHLGMACHSILKGYHPYTPLSYKPIQAKYLFEKLTWSVKQTLIFAHKLSRFYLTHGACLKVGWWLYVGRFLVGCGMGLLSYVVIVVTLSFSQVQFERNSVTQNKNNGFVSSVFIIGTSLCGRSNTQESPRGIHHSSSGKETINLFLVSLYSHCK